MNIQEALAQGPEIVGRAVDEVCQLRAQAQAQARANGALANAMALPGGPLPGGTIPGGPSCGSGLPPGLLPAHGIGVGCPGVYTTLIQETYQRKCQAVCDPCWLKLLDESIGRQSWPMVRNQVGLTYLKFQNSGYVATGQPTPDPDSSATTDFVANVPIAPGESILVRQMLKFTLPWRPGCLKLTLGFSAGDMANNMTHIQVKVFVMRRGNFQASGNLRAFLVEWNPDEYYSGDMFRCGDNCAEVQIIGTLGCGGVEHVGDDNELFLQVFNDAAATNNITAINTTISFDGVRKACCGNCYTGKGGCNCGGS